ncbi:LysR family transcriptional regulator [Nocardia colli]|uniref:LysR family transcriptional regulator n=1 Tax=Nocardia colli TaxID=2545717 RepID=A0A5N0E336_9NOCA|nr:LysR family transcriptional regulator [Nocardia colli]KAA8883822.1 LysR family transcriptional regulator [Nocardia colli]
MHYDLVDLRLFLDIVTEGSITAGARRMHLSLPSASARVRALENQAGLPLLIRGRRGVRPTPAGATLARHAREVLRQTARLDSALAGYTHSPVASLTLLGGGGAMHRIIPQALISFLRAEPGIDVVVAERRTPRMVRMLTDGEADLGVLIDNEAGDCGLEVEPLCDGSLVVIGQAGGILTGRTTLTYREVAEHPLVGLDTGSSLQQWIEQNIGTHGGPHSRYRTRVANLTTVITLVAAGVGLAIVPRNAVIADESVAVCELSDPWSRRHHLLAWGAEAKASSPALTALAHHIRQAAAD